MTIALDATYSLGEELSGVGLYSREILSGLPRLQPEVRWRFCYRSHRYFRSLGKPLPPGVRRGLLAEPWGPRSADLFHGLNQRLPRLRLRRSAVTFHDLFVMTGEYSSAEFRARFTRQAREAAQRADLLLAVSTFTKAQIVDLLGVAPERVRVVHHGIRRLPYPPQTPREKIVLSVGAIQTRKNTARLIEAFRSVDPAWRLVLAGAAGYGAEKILADLPERVTVTGYISEQELAHWYARASVFAFPSLDEGFGMPVLEAMAAGTPVITSSRSALPEVAGDAALLIDPEDTGALAGVLRQLTEDEDLRRELAARGRARARLFSWERAVRETWQVYGELLSGFRHPPQSSKPEENDDPETSV